MIRHRTRDGGFHHANIDGMIFLAIIVTLAAIALPQYLKIRDRRASLCLGNLLALADGKPPGKAVCPISDKAYAPGPDLVACPAPEKHLDSAPSLVRSKEGPWKVRQTLPSSAGRPIEYRDSRLEVKEQAGRVAVLVKPGAFARFFLAPLGFLILSVITIACLVAVFLSIRAREWFEGIVPFLVLPVAGGLAFLSMEWFATSHEWILERAGARVTRVDYFFGSRRSEQTISGCLGVVPTVATDGHRLQLVHPPNGEGARTTDLGLIPKDRLDVADWFHRALIGP
jgi:hypothetical protein